MSFKRTRRYRAAINELADAIAAMPINELAASQPYWSNEVRDDVMYALARRHPKFDRALFDAGDKIDAQRTLERRPKRAGRQAAVTRARRNAARTKNETRSVKLGGI